MTEPVVVLLSIGNEILLGDVGNTNAQWLAKRVTARGATVAHIAVVRDRPEEIAGELGHALAYEPQLVVATGGLGPTDDDLTASAVAAALGRDLALDPVALGMVEGFYRHLADEGRVAHAELDEPRTKMARLPRGALPLANRVGAAPGILLREGPVSIVLLPGVPAEMADIFEGSLRPVLDELLGPGGYREVESFARTSDESRLAPLLREVVRRHPNAYVKSRAERFGQSAWFHVTISARGSTRDEAMERVGDAERDLVTTLRGAGIEVEKRPPPPD